MDHWPWVVFVVCSAVALAVSFSAVLLALILLSSHISLHAGISKGVQNSMEKAHGADGFLKPSVAESTSDSIRIGDPTYYYPRIQTPVVPAGYALRAFSYLLNESFLGTSLTHYMLNKNDMHVLRLLASQIHAGTLLSYPMARLGLTEMNEYNAELSRAKEAGLDHKGLLGCNMNDTHSITSHFDHLPAFYKTSRVYHIYESYRTGEDTPTKAMARLIDDLIPPLQKEYRMFQTLNREYVMTQAKTSEERWKQNKPLSILDGVPIAFKDMVLIKGFVKTNGSAARAKFDPPSVENEEVILRFKSLGAIILGTTTMTEGGVTTWGYCAHANGPFNPHGPGIDGKMTDFSDLFLKKLSEFDKYARKAYAPVRISGKLHAHSPSKNECDSEDGPTSSKNDNVSTSPHLLPYPFRSKSYKNTNKGAPRYSGGSSSGNSVAVSFGLVPITVGFDGGGSIRVPAAWSGTVGLATTFGRMETRIFSSTMIKSGPQASTVADAAIGYMAMTIPISRENSDLPALHFYTELYGHHPHPTENRESTIGSPNMGPPEAHVGNKILYFSGKNIEKPPEMYQKKKFRQLRIGVFREYFNDSDPEVKRQCWAAVDLLVKTAEESCDYDDVQLVDITIPNLAWFRLAHSSRIATEFAQEWDSVMGNKTKRSHLESNTKITLAVGGAVGALDIHSSDRLRCYLFNYMREEIFSGKYSVDVIVSPTMPSLAPEIGSGGVSEASCTEDGAESSTCYKLRKGFEGVNNLGFVVETMKFVFLANFIGLPAISVPIGYHEDSSDQLPIGLQLTGNHWMEHKLLVLGGMLQESLNNPNKNCR